MPLPASIHRLRLRVVPGLRGLLHRPALLVVFVMLLRSTMGTTGPETVKASKTAPVLWEEVQGVDAAKEELVDVAEWLKDPKRFEAPRRPRAARRPALRPAGHRQDDARPRGRRARRRRLLRRLGLELRRDVRRPRRGPDPAPLQGGARVRARGDLHRRARRRRRPSRRGGGDGGTSEREQALNQLLVELDGFERDPGTVIVLAASNDVEKLDKALLRPGRFDRQVLVAPPDRDGREAILRAHAKGKPLADDLDLPRRRPQDDRDDRRPARQRAQRGGDHRRPRRAQGDRARRPRRGAAAPVGRLPAGAAPERGGAADRRLPRGRATPSAAGWSASTRPRSSASSRAARRSASSATPRARTATCARASTCSTRS